MDKFHTIINKKAENVHRYAVRGGKRQRKYRNMIQRERERYAVRGEGREIHAARGEEKDIHSWRGGERVICSNRGREIKRMRE